MGFLGILGRDRSSIADDRAPSVTLAVKLPSPPYASLDETPGKGAKVLKADRVTVKVGLEYDFITSNIVARVRVEKIWQEKDKNIYVVISQKNSQGVRITHAIHMSEFKQRVLQGGIPEIQI